MIRDNLCFEIRIKRDQLPARHRNKGVRVVRDYIIRRITADGKIKRSAITIRQRRGQCHPSRDRRAFHGAWHDLRRVYTGFCRTARFGADCFQGP